ncbi:LRR receptor-like serine/threonine-protein kinase GSO1 [Coffea eugenioides]|uniref:LRR receptor-like serine/threonine-protein kinase GSO1 n=1 Tax=Coffea eugenioides TaxID=49369 RepID=UPI000F60C80F|nr:LRR receptor-like serine/threonine-protein kinase GSO1 [Coffea eugenioides]
MERILRRYFPLAVLFQHFPMACLANIETNIATDQSALVAFKEHILSDPYLVLEDNWTANTSVCDWIGVTCGIQHHRVTALNISFTGLTGSIPPHLGNLYFLVSLDLSGNNFLENLSRLRRLRSLEIFRHGKIPEVMGDLQNLRVLNLQYNPLTGSIPSIIFNISALEIIVLSGNNLPGNLPPDMCNDLPSLTGLYLTSNKFNGQLPSNLTACSVIQLLSLSSNEFSGQIPTEYGALKKLEGLYLARNSLIGFCAESVAPVSLRTTVAGISLFLGHLLILIG